MTTKERDESDTEPTDVASSPTDGKVEHSTGESPLDPQDEEPASPGNVPPNPEEPAVTDEPNHGESAETPDSNGDQSGEGAGSEKERVPEPIDSPKEGAGLPKKKKPSKRKRSKDKRSGGGRGLTPLGFVLRFFAAIALVFGTFNPSENSYYHWVATFEGSDLPAKILLGLLILAGWVVFFRATSRSLGPVGAILAAAVCGVALWWLIDLQIVAQESNAITYAVLFIISVILTLGLTGSFVWRRLTGQYQVDSDDGGLDD